MGLFIGIYWPIELSLLRSPDCTVLEDRDGVLLAAQIATDGQWRFPMMDTLPETFVSCITSYEDKRYQRHIGIDPFSIVRALRQNIKAGRVISGGSTIPMQIMRMSMNHRERSIINKLVEAIGAIRLDAQYSKEEMLKIYASYAPFGGNVVGLEAAAWKYFDKSPFELSWAEMATLAVLPNAPSLITFSKNRALLLDKRNFLLHKLRKRHIIDDLELELSLEEPLASGTYRLSQDAPHYLQYLKKKGSSGRIVSSIDGGLQQTLNEILAQHYGQLSQNDIHNAAILLIDNRSAKVLAYCGNILSTTEEQDVDMIQAHRSTGSILKPLLYLAMIDGAMLTPHALVSDIPIYISRFTPANYNGQFMGLVAADEALRKSLNIPFVIMLQRYGVEKFRRQLETIGLSTINKSGNSHYGLSLILGGAEVSVWELTQVYSSMARSLSGGHDFLWSRGSIFHTLEAMRHLERPDDRGNWRMFSSSQSIAWKTGTSYGHRDAWSVGMTPDYTIGVWVGNADGEGRDKIVGVSTAGRILFDVVEALPLDNEWWDLPYTEMQWIPVCQTTGLLPSVHCTALDTVLLTSSVMRSELCNYHEVVTADITGQWRVDQQCYTGEIRSSQIMRLSPQEAKYYLPSHPRVNYQLPWHPNCRRAITDGNLQITYPNAAERIYIPRDFNNSKQKLIAEVTHKDRNSKVYWYVNKSYLGTTQSFHSIELDLPIGEHELYCIDNRGEERKVNFEITSE